MTQVSRPTRPPIMVIDMIDNHQHFTDCCSIDGPSTQTWTVDLRRYEKKDTHSMHLYLVPTNGLSYRMISAPITLVLPAQVRDP